MAENKTMVATDERDVRAAERRMVQQQRRDICMGIMRAYLDSELDVEQLGVVLENTTYSLNNDLP